MKTECVEDGPRARVALTERLPELAARIVQCAALAVQCAPQITGCRPSMRYRVAYKADITDFLALYVARKSHRCGQAHQGGR